MEGVSEGAGIRSFFSSKPRGSGGLWCSGSPVELRAAGGVSKQNNLLTKGCAGNGMSGKLQGKGNVLVLPLDLSLQN